MLKKGPFIGMSQIVRVIADDNQVLLYLEAIPCHTESHFISSSAEADLCVPALHIKR